MKCRDELTFYNAGDYHWAIHLLDDLQDKYTIDFDGSDEDIFMLSVHYERNMRDSTNPLDAVLSDLEYEVRSFVRPVASDRVGYFRIPKE